MNILKAIVKDKNILEKIDEQFKSLGEELADINEFPIHIPRFFSLNKEPNTKLGRLLLNSYLLISESTRSTSLEKLISIVNGINKSIIFFAERPGVGITKETLIIQIISSEVKNYFPGAVNYINIRPHQNKVFKTIKELELDKYNLISINNNFQLENHGIIYKNKYLIYYHPFLRRFYTSNFTIGNILKNVHDDKNINLKLAIDPIRLSTPQFLKHIVEADYWHGPLFLQNKLNDTNFFGITVYARSPNMKMANFSWPIDKTIFYISNKKDIGLKQIEIEELNPNTGQAVINNEYVFQKYAHLIWDGRNNFFSHFDVAVKIYTLAEHKKRLNYDWETRKTVNPAKTVTKIKLFRLDGAIGKETLFRLLGDFFRGNELINEFFEGNKTISTIGNLTS